MKHQGTVVLTTERLTLRPITQDDAQAMFDTWAGDARVTKYLTWGPHKTAEVTARVVAEWVKCYEQADFYQWVLDLDGKILGAISVVRLDERSNVAELGYCMGVAAWNQGFMTEAARAVIEFLFNEVGANRIVIEHAVKNPASGRVAEKCGMTYEGTKREAFLSSWGEYLDIAVWSLLKRDRTTPAKGSE